MTLPSARTPVVDRDKAANVIATGKILRMNASSLVSTGDAGRYSRSFGLSASVASPPCGEWKSLLRHRSDRP